MKNLHYFAAAVLTASLLVACQSPSKEGEGVITVPVRTQLAQQDIIPVSDDVEKIEYIPLETGDSCLVSNILSMQVSRDYLFIYNGKTNQILQFDRAGKFVRTIGCTGNGPGEYTLVSDLVIDEANQQLYIFCYGEAPRVYGFDGQYLLSDTTLQGSTSAVLLDERHIAMKGLRMYPNAWLAALKEKGGEITAKVDPYEASLTEDVSYMENPMLVPAGKSALAFATCNDTVFRLSPEGIEPAYCLARQNRTAFYTDVADIRQRKNNPIQDSDLDLYDFFETPRYLYLRVMQAGEIYIQRYSKADGTCLSCRVPEAYLSSSRSIPGNNAIGLTNDVDQGVPFWPEFAVNGRTSAQVVTYDLISGLQEEGYLKDMPDALKALGADDNPLIIIYTYKQ